MLSAPQSDFVSWSFADWRLPSSHWHQFHAGNANTWFLWIYSHSLRAAFFLQFFCKHLRQLPVESFRCCLVRGRWKSYSRPIVSFIGRPGCIPRLINVIAHAVCGWSWSWSSDDLSAAVCDSALLTFWICTRAASLWSMDLDSLHRCGGFITYTRAALELS